jgi:DNA-directed RNA polymerase subunit beta
MRFVNDLVSTRQNGEYTLAPSENVNLDRRLQSRLVSVAASRSSKTMTQTAPLMGSEHASGGSTPASGRGPAGWYLVSKKSSHGFRRCDHGKRAGIIDQVDATRNVVRVQISGS